jgi:hypothetical protein
VVPPKTVLRLTRPRVAKLRALPRARASRASGDELRCVWERGRASRTQSWADTVRRRSSNSSKRSHRHHPAAKLERVDSCPRRARGRVTAFLLLAASLVSMRRAFFFIVAVLFATTSSASIPRTSALDPAPPLADALSETRIRVSDVPAPFAQPPESEVTRALRQAYEQSSTTNASGWGRFLSVDPAWESGDLGKPQSWNRYAYVLNDPINRADPDGRSSMVFNRDEEEITLYDKDGRKLGTWKASNNPRVIPPRQRR